MAKKTIALNRWKRLPAALLALWLLMACALAEGLPLSLGSRGDLVVTVKERLYRLGYYKTSTLTKQYTEDTVTRVRRFQQAAGLPETGTVDQATWDLLFSDAAPKSPHPTMKPLSPASTPQPPEYPPRDEAGYLAGEGEYVYENEADGLWVYLSKNLQITITRLLDPALPLEWFETEILCREGEGLRTVLTNEKKPAQDYRYPTDIAQRERLVLAFSDDFFAERVNKKQTVGVIIRNGKIISSATNAKTGGHLPNLDMMAQYPDGSLAVYECNAYSAQELLDMGAVNVFSFGPILIRDGEINEMLYDTFRSIEPRHALGMIAPSHYLVLSMEGRTQGSDGTVLQRVAEIMKARGVTQALNLDGGNTMAVVFRGKMLNKLAVYDGKKFVRKMTSMIGIGKMGK